MLAVPGLAAAGLFAIDGLGIEELLVPAAFELFATAVTVETVLAGLTALFESTGELPHAPAMASVPKSVVVSRTLVFINLFLSYSPPQAADR